MLKARANPTRIADAGVADKVRLARDQSELRIFEGKAPPKNFIPFHNWGFKPVLPLLLISIQVSSQASQSALLSKEPTIDSYTSPILYRQLPHALLPTQQQRLHAASAFRKCPA